VSRIASPVLERALALPRGLLAGSIARMPWRLGATAGALMVAVSILVSTRSNGDAIIRDLRERVRFADGFVFCTSGLSKDEQARVRALPGVADALPVGYLPLRIAGEQVFGVDGMGPSNVVCVGFEPRPFIAMNRLDWIEGTPETAIPRLEEGDAILVAPEFLVARGLGVGSRLRLGSGANEAEFEIVGVVTAAGLDIATQTFGMRQIYMEQAVSCVFMDFRAVERHFDTRDAYIMQLRLAAGLDESGEKALGEAVSDAVPGAVFSSGRAIRGFVEEIGGTVLAVTSAVALAALALAAIGVGSVVAAGISARTREFGVLRAVGGSTRVLVALVLCETTIMALAALVSGSALGLTLAWMGVALYRDFAGLRLAWVIPWGPMAAGAAIVIAVALLAATPAVVRLARKPTRELVAGA
jgi:putative ABC transport system permease protein